MRNESLSSRRTRGPSDLGRRTLGSRFRGNDDVADHAPVRDGRGSGARIAQNRLRRLFADHVERGHDEQPGMRGKIDASTMRKPLQPCTRKLESTTPPLSGSPIVQVDDA